MTCRRVKPHSHPSNPFSFLPLLLSRSHCVASRRRRRTKHVNWVCSTHRCRVRVISRMAAAATVSRLPLRTVHHMVEVAIPVLPPLQAQLPHRMVCSTAAFPRLPVTAMRRAPRPANIRTSTSSISTSTISSIASTMAMNPTRMDAHVPSTSAWASPPHAQSWTRVPVSLK